MASANGGMGWERKVREGTLLRKRMLACSIALMEITF